jgi:peroxiredoxin
MEGEIMMSVSRLWCAAVMCGLVATLSGCGGSNSSTPVAANSPDQPAAAESPDDLLLAIPGLKPAATGKPAATPAAASKGAAPSGDKPGTQPARKEPAKGSPEWLLLEIQRIKVLPLPGSESKRDEEETPEGDDEERKPLTAAEEQKLREQFEKTKQVRHERNLQIIKLAEECIAKTAKQPDQEAEFNAAVHYLLDSRLQLALQGDSVSINALYDAAKVFFDRDPKSTATVESQLTLVNLTHANALRYGQSQPKWIQEFAKHAELFAVRFPDEQARSVSLLAAAARTCELAGLTDEAKSCYTLLIKQFKETPQARQAEGVVRRLQLKGKTLELTGPTMDGGEVNIESFRGKMVVVVFWASHARPFVEQLPKLTATLKKYEKYATVVGVNLDADEGAVELFLDKSGLTWPQIFSPNRALRGWNSPLAIHYGINNLPTIWLIDPNGVVADTAIDADNLEARLREVYLPFLKNAVKPASGAK